MKLRSHTLDVADLEPVRSRHTGMHLSQVLRHILHGQDPKRFKGDAIDPVFVFAGFIWEEVISGALGRMARDRRRYLQQVEVLFRGLWCTVDTFDTKLWRVHEYKYTETSSRRRKSVV